MTIRRGRVRLSVQAKVLGAVLGILVVLEVTTVALLNRHVHRQMQDEAVQTLANAQTVFSKSLEMRSRDLVLRYANIVHEPRFKATAELRDAKTMTRYLHDMLGELGEDSEALVFVTDRGARLAEAQRDPALSLENFTAAADDLSRAALDGSPSTGSLHVGEKAYNVVAIPVSTQNEETVEGVLLIAQLFGEAAAQELKALTRTEIVLVANERVTVSTIVLPEPIRGNLARLAKDHEDEVPGVNPAAPVPVEIEGEHFLAVSALAEARGGAHAHANGFRLVLLSSYEQRLRALDTTKKTFFALAALGLIAAGLVIWFFIRRITQPLRALRDSAEAVGRGDFSQRIERFSNDECGELAEAFNRMTSNLDSSRAALEKTMESLKGTQAQLIQSEKLSAVGQFVAGVAHELNNPLTAVIGFSELCLHDADPKLRPMIELIVKSANRCHKIVHNLLSFARLHPAERKRVDLHKLIDEALEIMAYDFRTSNLTIVRDFAPTPPPLLADAHLLQQVLVNILNNARQAMQAAQPSGTITVKTRSEGRLVRIELQDSGPGIRPEHLARIFDPFFTTKPVGKGTGLGLSLCYGIIEEHGGKISVQSVIGQGASFTIELPIADPSKLASIENALPLRRSEETARRGEKILVVDDEEWILQLTNKMLVDAGYRVATATNGDAALALLARENFAVILSDWKMPGMNGVQLFEHLNKSDPRAASTMIFMTGDVVSDKLEAFVRTHAIPCLTKPFSMKDLRMVVSERLGKKETVATSAK